MKHLSLFLLFLTLSCNSQNKSNHTPLSVSPAITTSPENQKIIAALKLFLASKNESLTANVYWDADDFKKHPYPYEGIFNIEQSKFGADFYRPTLMEIVPTPNNGRKAVKLAYVGHNSETGENLVRTIYNLMANTSANGTVKFSSYLDYAVNGWERQTAGSVSYIVSPQKQFNRAQAKKQEDDIEMLCSFFGCKPIGITYYSCINAVELFRIKGFDYTPAMYYSENGGLAEPGDIIFSANNSECYTHEIVHIYTHNLFPNCSKILDEGIATYLGGSGNNDYEWHKNKLKAYLQQNTVDFEAMVDNPYERLYIDGDTPIPYVVGGLICEKIIRDFGKDKLMSLLQRSATTDVWTLLAEVGINKQTIAGDLKSLL